MYLVYQGSQIVQSLILLLVARNVNRNLLSSCEDEENQRVTYMDDDGERNQTQLLHASYVGTIISHRGYPNLSYHANIYSNVSITGLDPKVNQYVGIKFKDFDLANTKLNLHLHQNNSTLPSCVNCSFLVIGNRYYLNGSVYLDKEIGNAIMNTRPPIGKWLLFKLRENETQITFKFLSGTFRNANRKLEGRGFKFFYVFFCGNVTCPETTPVTNPSEKILSNTPTSRTNTMAIVTTVAGISLIAATSVIAATCCKIKSRRMRYERQDDELDEMEHDWYRSLEPATAVKLKEILINLNRLCFNTGNVLGEGYFGSIYLGELQLDDSGDNPRQISQVAVKVLKDVRYIERDNLANKLVNEALLLSGFSHENVLNTLGICIPQRGQLCVVLPYMAHGDLRRFVKNKDTKLSVGDLMSLAQHVAKGMEYLSSNLFVHRDLAARNCLVDIDYTVKIADFGLSRDIYKKGYYTQLNLTSVPLPVKWTALEGLKDGTFTSFSDVWSFGVLVWELFTRGGEPYADVNIWEMKSYVEQGRRLEAPQGTPPDIYKLMTTCWEDQPDRRPTFKEIVEYLDKSLGSRE